MKNHKRMLAKAGLRLTKSLIESSGPDHMVLKEVSCADLDRIWRNRIWSEYGQEELEAMETEINLGLPEEDD